MEALLLLDQLSTADVTRLTGVSTETVRRWRRRANIPPLYRRLLLARATTDHLWPGWSIRGESLYTPSGAEIRKGTIEALPILIELKEHLQRELRTLRAAPVQYLVFPPG